LRPSWSFDSERFSRINWLVVRQTVTLEADVGKRAWPFLFETFNRDFFKIEPHQERYPAKVEQALFALLLAPWEDWTEHRDLNWRGFSVPWVHTVDEDLFVSRHRLPSSQTLSFEPDFYEVDGETIELERRVRYPLGEAAAGVVGLIDNVLAVRVEEAMASPLFTTPITHFLVRAFAADGIDEFMGHLTMLEAGLGQHEHQSTASVKARLAGLLQDSAAAATYGELFELRSQFVHGRSMAAISGEDRCRARSLARRTAMALVEHASRMRFDDRPAELEALRAQGAAHLKPASASARQPTSPRPQSQRAKPDRLARDHVQSTAHGKRPVEPDMAAAENPPLDPDLVPLIEALARVMVKDQQREMAQAAPEIAALRSALGLEDDFQAWKQKAEQLMEAFYEQVSRWSELSLAARLRLMTAAVEELGRQASVARIAAKASQLAELELGAAKPSKRKPLK
jgi:hypothetical protein